MSGSQSRSRSPSGIDSKTRTASFNRPHDWQDFERLTRDLFARLSGDAHADLNGRSGQPQCGVDISCVDQITRQQIGIQCRGRNSEEFGAGRRVTEKELRAEVQKALKFYPRLDRFILVTTGPNDSQLKKLAAKLSNDNKATGLFEVQFHGWDWIEARLYEHLDLALSYGLVAVVALSDDNVSYASKIAREIGIRFHAAITMMNEGRDIEDRFTLQSLARHLGLVDWRRLELIAEGRSDADMTELKSIADGLGVSDRWLIEGKGEPFHVDPEDYRDATEQYEPVINISPEQLIFVRESTGHHDSFVVAQVNDVKWYIFRNYHPSGPHVGGTGRHQLIDYCCLMRRLYRTLDYSGQCGCYGYELETAQFWDLLAGKVYPGSLFRFFRNNDWWHDFAELAEARVDGDTPERTSLREAISIVRSMLVQFQERAVTNKHLAQLLTDAGLPLRERSQAELYPLETGLRRR